MLRANLSTRPFYNTRIVRVGLIAIAVVAAGLTAFNAVELWRLQRANREFSDTVRQNDESASALRAKAQTVQQSLDRSLLAQLDAAAREANALIDRRAFSWTELDSLGQPHGAAWQQALVVATAVYDGKHEPTVPNALYYHAKYIKPRWAKPNRRVATIGSHVFYR